jgi:hypothetical protein
MDPTGVIDKLISFGTAVWRRYRFGARARIDLAWQHVPLVIVPGPNTKWRSIALTVTAAKSEEFVIADGEAEARKGKRGSWSYVAALSELLQLPIVVEANRQWTGHISGSSFAKKLQGQFDASGKANARLTLVDHHRSMLRTNPLTVTRADLLREEQY